MEVSLSYTKSHDKLCLASVTHLRVLSSPLRYWVLNPRSSTPWTATLPLDYITISKAVMKYILGKVMVRYKRAEFKSELAIPENPYSFGPWAQLQAIGRNFWRWSSL